MSIFENEIATTVLNICFKIHRQYGPGLLESVYEGILCYELTKHEIEFVRQYPIEVVHDQVRMNIGFRADVIVENAVLLELKSVSKLEDVFFKTVGTYLKLTRLKLGLLINFNEVLLKDGIKRVVNGL
jgi:GxxExxY protein